MAVEAARVTMMTYRAAHDELRREGEARLRRKQEITKELSGWRHRLETAEKRSAELADRKEATVFDLDEAAQVPEEIAEKREDLSEAIEDAQARGGIHQPDTPASNPSTRSNAVSRSGCASHNCAS